MRYPSSYMLWLSPDWETAVRLAVRSVGRTQAATAKLRRTVLPGISPVAKGTPPAQSVR